MIPIYQPSLNGNEKKYILECLDSGWISSRGAFINKFEKEFEKYLDISFATTVTNGTVALHLALSALGIKSGDEVIVPTFTYVASVNTIVQCGAKPIFVDIDGDSLQVDVKHIKNKISSKTKAIMAVHLYGQACDIEVLRKICDEYNLYLIEDCAEALGSSVNGKKVGTFGDVSTFSFFGNKTITSGEGGMVVSNNKNIMNLCLKLKNQGVVENKRYWHDRIAFNYRMTNLCAAIGLAQLERIEYFINRKREIANLYQELLKNLPLHVHREIKGTTNTYWLVSIILDENISNHRDYLISYLDNNHIESRPFFYPAHTLPMYIENNGEYPLSENFSARGINLPSWPDLTNDQVKKVCLFVSNYFKSFEGK